jgi:hypothetical protein
LNGATLERPVAAGATECALGAAELPAGPGRLEAEVAAGTKTTGVHYVTVRRAG